MRIKQSKNYKKLKAAQIAPVQQEEPAQQEEPIQQEEPAGLNPAQLKTFAMQLKMSATEFASKLGQYSNQDEALMELQNIQSLTQKLIASIQSGTRKTVVNPQQMVQQTREIAKMKAPRPGQQPVL
jgi:hypothetical protein